MFLLLILLMTAISNSSSIAWEQLGQDIDGEAPFDRSGATLSMSSDGQIVAIGALKNDGNGNSAGHVRMYSFNGTTWSQLGQDIDGEAEGDESGYSVTLSSDGNTVAIGTPMNDGNGYDSGHVRVYRFGGFSWIQLGQDIDGEVEGDYSGWSVALSLDGNTVAIGAPDNGGNGNFAGHTRVYRFDGTTWSQLGQDIDGENEYDGSGMSIDLADNGETVAIGATSNDGNGNLAGHARVYRFDGTTWSQLGQDIDGEAEGDEFGWSVSLSSDGNTVACGAPVNVGNGGQTGHVRVYSFGGTTWSQVGQDIDGEAGGDFSGVAVSLSSDGDTVAIGASNNAGNSGISGQGHVRVYRFGGATWSQLGQDIDGEEELDYSGVAVSLSSDGNIVAIGAPYNVGNGEDSGHVRVYRLPPTQSPTDAPTDAPTAPPTSPPTAPPTDAPTVPPTVPPTDAPTDAPGNTPTDAPTDAPTGAPTDAPTDAPTVNLKGETDSDNTTIWIVVGAVITPTVLAMVLYYFLKNRYI